MSSKKSKPEPDPSEKWRKDRDRAYAKYLSKMQEATEQELILGALAHLLWESRTPSMLWTPEDFAYNNALEDALVTRVRRIRETKP